MKKILLTLLLLPIGFAVNAQDYKLFIDDNGKSASAFSATSYIIVKQLGDTAWLMQHYDMQNEILQSGTFKDKNLQIPNGKFVYYRKLNFYNSKQLKELFKTDTVNCIITEGAYKDGKKAGRWTDYFIGGKKKEERYYKNGILNGPYQSYNDDRSTVALSGNYIDGKREGDWQMYNLEGKVMEKDQYRNGVMYDRKLMIDNYRPPQAPEGFEVYVDTELRKALASQNIKRPVAKYDISFTITADGKIVKPELLPSFNQDNGPIAKILLNIIDKSPLWKPANAGDDTKPVEDFASISVEVNKSNITTKVIDYGKVKAAFFNLTH